MDDEEVAGDPENDFRQETLHATQLKILNEISDPNKNTEEDFSIVHPQVPIWVSDHLSLKPLGEGFNCEHRDCEE